MDGFRALADVNGHQCQLVSRNGHVFKSWPQLAEEIAHSVRAHRAVIDGEIVSLDPDGRNNFKKLLFRREWPFFYAFDLLTLDGRDLRHLRLIERKRRLRAIMPRVETRLLLMQHFERAWTCSPPRASATWRGLSQVAIWSVCERRHVNQLAHN